MRESVLDGGSVARHTRFLTVRIGDAVNGAMKRIGVTRPAAYRQPCSRSIDATPAVWRAGAAHRPPRSPPCRDRYALFFNCQADLVETYRRLYPELSYAGNRGIVFDLDSTVPREALRHCIALALTYHPSPQQNETTETSCISTRPS